MLFSTLVSYVTGLLLLAVTLVFGFSGYLLPWDNLSFFATRVGIGEIEKAPLVGGWLAHRVRGGPDVRGRWPEPVRHRALRPAELRGAGRPVMAAVVGYRCKAIASR